MSRCDSSTNSNDCWYTHILETPVGPIRHRPRGSQIGLWIGDGH